MKWLHKVFHLWTFCRCFNVWDIYLSLYIKLTMFVVYTSIWTWLPIAIYLCWWSIYQMCSKRDVIKWKHFPRYWPYHYSLSDQTRFRQVFNGHRVCFGKWQHFSTWQISWRFYDLFVFILYYDYKNMKYFGTKEEISSQEIYHNWHATSI